MRSLFVVFLLNSFFFCYAQNETKIDSVNLLLQKTTSVNEKLSLHKEALYLKTAVDLEGLIVNVEALKEMGKEEDCPSCLGVALYWEGLYHYLKGDLQKGVPFFETAIVEAFAAKDYYTGNRSNTLLSGVYFGLNDYVKSEKYAQNLIEFGKSQPEITDAYIDGYFMMGLINDDQSYYSLAINNYNIADSLNTVKKGANYYSYQAKLYNNLSIVFIQIKDFKKAQLYLNKTRENYAKDDNIEGLNSVKQNISYLRVEESRFSEAIPSLLETKDFYESLGMTHRAGEADYLLGRAHFGLKEYRKSIPFLENAIEIFKTSGDTLNAGLGHKYLGDSYFHLKELSNSEKNLSIANNTFGKLNAHRNQLNTLKSLTTLYEARGDYLYAIKRFREIDSINTIFQTKQNEKRVFELDTQHQTKKKEQEIALLQAQNETAEAKRKNQRNILLGGIGLISLAGIFLLLGYRNRKKTNDKLRELDGMKSSFFANISHEFRTPLSLIAGPIEEQLRKKDIDDSEKKSLETAQRNSQRLVTLVDQLLDLSKLEAGHFTLRVQTSQLGTFLKGIVSSFEYAATAKSCSYCSQILIEDNHWFDQDMVEKITTNLISNAIKYSSEKAEIQVLASVVDSHLKLTVRNTGTALNEDELSNIFNRFYRANEEQVGSGIGLAHTKELVALHKGFISAASDRDWTTFEVNLPVSEAAFTDTEKKTIEEGTLTTPAFAKAQQTHTPPIEDKEVHLDKLQENNPILLIVDDNEDLRNYVSSLFQDQFTIVTEKNGKDGFTKALEVVPDVIITDLMMAEEDGLTFTKNCKTNEATSHIPIMMLTAKAGNENELIGIETGADAYLTKPFSTEILKATVHNLQESRRILQERFSQEVVLLPKDIATNSIDEKFIENLQAVMDQKLVESDFNTEAFAQAVGMSRMQLHRKLKALTGLSSTEFIRNQRLKLAAQLLKKSEINVSQVGYTVGFNNHSYFTKCFKEQYGCSPSEYIKKF
jgi:signal transduction histidine kinase/DNA-binding response OmpR family regulator